MARKNMYIRDDPAAAAKRGRIGDASPYAGYAAAPAATPAPAGAYYVPAPAVSVSLNTSPASRLQYLSVLQHDHASRCVGFAAGADSSVLPMRDCA